MFELLFLLLIIVLPLLGLLWVVLTLFGFRMVRHPKRVRVRPRTANIPVPEFAQPASLNDRTSILLNALDSPPFSNILLPDQRQAILQALLHPELSQPVPPLDLDAVTAQAVAGERFTEMLREEPASLPGVQLPAARDREAGQPVSVPHPPAPHLPTRPRASVEAIRASWDPAVVMLYLGALLVVIAGLIFASYSWGTWSGGQKLGMLIAATAAFLLVGFALQRFERIRPAAETFLTIGGLLVPVNALAAYTIFHKADLVLVLFAGALATAIVHGILAFQPDSRMFRYTSVAAVLLALTSLPGALGLPTAWGSALTLAVVALAPDPWGRLERFGRAWMVVGTLLILPLLGIGLALNQGEQSWLLPALLIATSLNANRVGQRSPEIRDVLTMAADVLLVIANVTAAWVLTDERWLVAAALLSVALILVRMSRSNPIFADQLEMVAAFPAAAFLGNVVADLFIYERGLTVFFGAITVAMLLLAQRWPRNAPLAHGIVVFSLPAAIFVPLDPIWDMAVVTAVLTITLSAWRTLHNTLGDAPYAAASFTAIAAVFLLGNAFEIDSLTAWTWMLVAVAMFWSAAVNLLTPFMLATWVRNLMRVQALGLFLLAFFLKETWPWVLLLAIVVMGWNVLATRSAIWSLPAAGLIAYVFDQFVILENLSDYWTYIGHTAPILALAALALQLDRRTIQRRVPELPAGIYVWLVVVAVSVSISESWQANSVAALIGIPLGWLAITAVHVVAYRSTAIGLFLLPALAYIGLAFEMLLRPAVPDRYHAMIAVIALAGAVLMYWRESHVRSWAGFALLATAVLHLNAAIDQPAVPGVLVGLAAAWMLMSTGIVRRGTMPEGRQLQAVFLQSMLLHGAALWAPSLGDAATPVSQSAFVLTMLSLAGTIAVYGSLLRERIYMLMASAVAMVALLVQINASDPANIHVYTVPLALYLLVVGLLFRKHSLEANVLLAAGSGVLVVPAMLEALSTGSTTWLWISLAESLALFLMGTTIRLQIPTAAGVISVTVIVLRMLVMVINAFESWVGILTIGVALLILGTIWLVFRDEIQNRVQNAYTRWLAFD